MKKTIPSAAEQASQGIASMDKWTEGKTRFRVTMATRDGKRTTFKATRAELSAKIEQAQTLKAIRSDLHLSQTGFARLLQAGASAVKQWEQGRRSIPAPVLALAELARLPIVRQRLETMAGPIRAPAVRATAAAGTQKRAAHA